MPQITVSVETLERLKAQAEPLMDTSDDVIQRLLDYAEGSGAPQLRDDSPRNLGSEQEEQWEAPLRRMEAKKTEQIRVIVGGGEKTRLRLGHGERTPQSEYRIPILSVLASMGGRARSQDILERVESRMKGRLRDVDYDMVSNKTQARWWNTANWERLQMVKDGVLRSGSPHGIWELSELGWAEARKLIEQ